MKPERACIPVVAGVLYRDDGCFVLSSRPPGKPYAGYWEFAGGKVEAHEDDVAALRREFAEELGIDILTATPWLCKIHDYEHARVRLHFYRIAANAWCGSLQAREGQSWRWQRPGETDVAPMLPANGPILAALAIPAAFSGNPATALASAEGMVLRPWRLAETGQRHLLFTEADLPQRRRFGADVCAFALINHMAQWLRVQDADAVVWQAADPAGAEALLSVLRQGTALPLLPLAPAALLASYGPRWLAAGAHGLIEHRPAVLSA